MTITRRKFLKFELSAQHLKGRLNMNLRSLFLAAVAAAIGFGGALEVKNAYAAEEQFFHC